MIVIIKKFICRTFGHDVWFTYETAMPWNGRHRNVCTRCGTFSHKELYGE